ncbi:MAG: outer membrane beta-barrel protein, partial [Bacteroidota bacterium]
YNRNRLVFTRENSVYFGGDERANFGYQLGLILNLESYNSPISFQVELAYSKKSSEIIKVVNPVPDSNVLDFKSELFFNVDYLSFPILAKYNPFYKKPFALKPFITVGFQNGIIIRQDIEIIDESPFFGTILFEDNIRKYESGFIAGIGLTKALKKDLLADFELRYSSTLFKTISPEEILRNDMFVLSIIFRK